MPNPYLIIGALLAVIGSAGAGYWKGFEDATARCETQKNAMIIESEKRKKDEAAAAHLAAKLLEGDNERSKTVYRTIVKTVDRLVDRPVLRSICIDDDGLRAANAAIAGTLPDPAEPADAMPEPYPAQ